MNKLPRNPVTETNDSLVSVTNLMGKRVKKIEIEMYTSQSTRDRASYEYMIVAFVTAHSQLEIYSFVFASLSKKLTEI